VVKDVCGVTLSAPTPVVGGTYTTCQGTKTSTYTYADCAGLQYVWTYTYTITHSTPPAEAGGPVSIASNVQCITDVAAPTILPVVKDVCGVTLSAPDPVVGGTYTSCQGTKTYTYTYVDCAGLQYIWTYTYNIHDTQPPALTCPGDIVVVCTPPAYTDFDGFITAGGSASDNCGLDIGSFIWVSDVSDGNTNPETITRTYKILDLCGNPATCQQIITVEDLNIVTYVYLEGAAIGVGGTQTFSLPMRTSLNNVNNVKVLPGQTYYSSFTGNIYTPAGQPYNVAPWNYSGTEGATYNSYGNPNPGTANYPSTVVDWVLVSLRETYDGAPVCMKAALLHNDGHVEFVNGGFDCCDLDMSNAYYLVIEHRNHLLVMSQTAVQVVNGTLTCDFRHTQSYGNGQKQILPGTYAMFAGNGDQTQESFSPTDINFDDATYWGSQNGTTGRYRNGDYNLNGDCNYNDRTTFEFNNGMFTSVPR
jgi:hypothetical protein